MDPNRTISVVKKTADICYFPSLGVINNENSPSKPDDQNLKTINGNNNETYMDISPKVTKKAKTTAGY
jgi:hypothetical protein